MSTPNRRNYSDRRSLICGHAVAGLAKFSVELGDQQDSSFCQFCPGFRPYRLAPNHGKLCRKPPCHSHSIVSDTYKHLNLREFL